MSASCESLSGARPRRWQVHAKDPASYLWGSPRKATEIQSNFEMLPLARGFRLDIPDGGRRKEEEDGEGEKPRVWGSDHALDVKPDCGIPYGGSDEIIRCSTDTSGLGSRPECREDYELARKDKGQTLAVRRPSCSCARTCTCTSQY